MHVCYGDYTNYRHLSAMSSNTNDGDIGVEVPPKKLQSACDLFDWKRACFYCGGFTADACNPTRNDFSVDSALPFRYNVLKTCDMRNNAWVMEVRGRLESCVALVSVEAVYHRLGTTRLNLGKTVVVI